MAVINTAIPNSIAMITGDGVAVTVKYPANDKLAGAAMIAIVGLLHPEFHG